MPEPYWSIVLGIALGTALFIALIGLVEEGYRKAFVTVALAAAAAGCAIACTAVALTTG